ARELFGFSGGERFNREKFIQNIHPGDRVLITTLARELEEGKNDFQVEFRMVSEEGDVRWMHTRGKVEPLGESRIIRGAIVDITKLKVAEEAVRELSHTLINTLEKERARVAREIHDDLSQRIALLLVQLTILRDDPKGLKYVQGQLGRCVSDLRRLSGD